MALTGLFDGVSPEEFTARVHAFMEHARHPTLGLPSRGTVYQPMLELIDELRSRDFSVFVVTGGGTEFVRAVSQDLYGVPPESVVGSLIGYDFVTDVGAGPGLTAGRPVGGRRQRGCREGHQHPDPARAPADPRRRQLGRRPRDARVGRCHRRARRLALLVDHDDAEREFAYVSTAQTFAEPEPITDVAARAGWTVISMARDWEVVFAT